MTDYRTMSGAEFKRAVGAVASTASRAALDG
jgi:hypothetical protein